MDQRTSSRQQTPEANGQVDISTIRDAFLAEARSAPTLFADLASVEQYIAETYRARSFIELVQNSDDAEATRMGFHLVDGGLVVGNDGREFTTEDLRSLCRSGASHKIRGQGTIGYRGIGFKSTVNLAQSIYVMSGSYSFVFDRNLTRHCFGDHSRVPLVRIPHDFPQTLDSPMARLFADFRQRLKYRTIFLFSDVNARAVNQELLGFDPTSLLFLKHLMTVEFESPDVHRRIHLKRVHRSDGRGESADLVDGDRCSRWLILRDTESHSTAAALKATEEGVVIPALPEESVLHAFTPCSEFSGASIKINGDFTTDPSRKTIDLDELSSSAYDLAVDLIASTISDLILRRCHISGFFRPFTEPSSAGRFRSILLQRLASRLDEGEYLILNGHARHVASVKVRPEWLNYEDFTRLCEPDIGYVPKELLADYPELPAFLQCLGATPMDLQLALSRCRHREIGAVGTAELLAKASRQFRYDMNSERVKELRQVPLLAVAGKLVSAADCAGSMPDIPYLDQAVLLGDLSDIQYCLTKLGVNLPQRFRASLSTASSQARTTIVKHTSDSVSRLEQSVSRWRSAETQVAEFLTQLENVRTVRDVTSANMGYDIEINLSDGSVLYVEVKSVARFGDPIKLTSNEYASAHSYGDAYVIAIAKCDKTLEVGFIRNPVACLKLTKQVERWAWLSEDYDDVLADSDSLR